MASAVGSNTAAALRELQLKLKQVTEERDALQKDVEALCLSTGDSMFSGSYMLTEQLTAVQKELKEAKRELKASQDRYQDCQQEVASLKAGHSALEHALASAKKEAASLSSERDFFQANAARAVADVQASQQEAEALRARLAEVELQLGSAEASASSEGRARRDAEAALAQRQQQVAQLRNELEQRKSEHASTSRQLASARESLLRLEGSHASLAAKLGVAGQDLEGTKAQLQQFRESEGRLRLQWQDAQALAAQLQGTSKGQAEQISALGAELSSLKQSSAAQVAELTASNQQLSRDLATAQEQVAELTAELRQSKQDLAALDAVLQEQRRAEHDHRAGRAAALMIMSSHHQPLPQQHSQQQHGDAHSAPAGTGRTSTDGAATSAANGAAHNSAEGEHSTATPPAGDSPGRTSPPPPSTTAVDGDMEGLDGASASAAPVPQHTSSSSGAAALSRVPSSGLARQGSQVVPLSEVEAAALAQDAADDAEQLAILRTMVHDLKVKLALATKEKVQALLAMAELKQRQQQEITQALQAAKQQQQQQQQQGAHHHVHHASMPSVLRAAGGKAGAPHAQSSGGAPPSGGASGGGFAAFMRLPIPTSLSSWMTGAGTGAGAAGATGASAAGGAAGAPAPLAGTASAAPLTSTVSSEGMPGTTTGVPSTQSAPQGLTLDEAWLGHPPVHAPPPSSSRHSQGAQTPGGTSPRDPQHPADRGGAGARRVGDGAAHSSASPPSSAPGGASPQATTGPSTPSHAAGAAAASGQGVGAGPLAPVAISSRQGLGSGGAGTAGGGVDPSLRQLASEAKEYVAGLEAAARTILSPSTHDPALKWSALSGLSKLHVQVNHTRARLGLTKASGGLLERTSNPLTQQPNAGPSAAGARNGPSLPAGAGKADSVDAVVTQLTSEVLDLVDLGLTCLDAYHRQEALSTVYA